MSNVWRCIKTALIAASAFGFTGVAVAVDNVKNVLARFSVPPQSAQPAVYWFWFWNDIRKEEITEQMEALHGQGIGTVEIRSICSHRRGDNNPAPGPGLKYMSPEWLDVFDHLLAEADRLGMKVGANLGMGWCYGGPWIPDELRTRAALFDGFAADASTDLAKAVENLEIVRVARFAKDPNSQRPAQVPDWLRVYGWRITDADQKTIDPGSFTDLSDSFNTSGGIFYSGKPLDGNWLLGVRTMVGGADPKHTLEETGGLGNSANPLSKKAIELQIKNVPERIRARSGAYFGKSFTELATDSWEYGWYIPYGLGKEVTFWKGDPVPKEKRLGLWSPEFDREFVRRKGYALEPRLAGLLGYGTAGNLTVDIEEVRQQLFLENFFEPITVWCRKNGIKHRPQAYGPELFRSAGGWARSDMPDIEQEYLKRAQEYRNGSYAAGLPVLNIEAFTWWGDATFNDLRHGANYYFGCGVNRIQYHSWSYSPERAGIPGWQMYVPYYYHINAPAFPYSHVINRWLARSQVLLQAGVPHVEVAALGQAIPESGPAISLDDVPMEIFAETLRRGALSVGAVLTTPNHAAAFRESGATIVTGVSDLPEPVFAVNMPSARNSNAQPWLVRRLEDGWLLAVFNQVQLLGGRGMKIRRPEAIIAEVRCNRPYQSVCLLDADTGAARAVEVQDGTIRLPVPPGESRFLLFTDRKPETVLPPEPQYATVLEIGGPWKVNRNLEVGVAAKVFEPTEPVTLTKLKPWSEIPNLSGYAGTATYETVFTMKPSELQAGHTFRLQAGRVGQVAKVWINGREIGHIWHAPWQVNIPAGVLGEKNQLRIDVANLYEDYTRETPGADSGIEGPVQILVTP